MGTAQPAAQGSVLREVSQATGNTVVDLRKQVLPTFRVVVVDFIVRQLTVVRIRLLDVSGQVALVTHQISPLYGQEQCVQKAACCYTMLGADFGGLDIAASCFLAAAGRPCYSTPSAIQPISGATADLGEQAQASIGPPSLVGA